jgi:hypothetical protein
MSPLDELLDDLARMPRLEGCGCRGHADLFDATTATHAHAERKSRIGDLSGLPMPDRVPGVVAQSGADCAAAGCDRGRGGVEAGHAGNDSGSVPSAWTQAERI